MAAMFRAFGWMFVALGILIFLFCAFMALGRSPHDFEGMMVGAAIGGILVVALPTFVVGVVMVGFANRKLRSERDADA